MKRLHTMQIQLYDILEKANDRHSKRISGCRGQGGGATPRFLWTKARWDPQADPERIIPRGSFWESGKTHTLPPWEVKQHKGPGKASFQGSSEEGKAQQPELPLHWHTWHRARVHRPGESTAGESMCVLASVCGQVCTHTGGWQHLGLPETISPSGIHVSSAPGNAFSILGAHETPVPLRIV